MANAETIKDRLARIRADAGLSTRDFGERVGVSHSTVANYEPGGSSDKVPGDYLATVCEVFDIDPRYILLGEGPVHRRPQEFLERFHERIMRAIEGGDHADD